MKKRLDLLICEKFGMTRNKAQSLIEEGRVKVGEKAAVKCGLLVDEDCPISLLEHDSYVSRGAYKLKKAIEVFGVELKGRVVLDMGASTGGFTQVALENGAKKVYAVDVGSDTLDRSLAQDKRVVNFEKTDIRSLTKQMVSDVDFVTGDLSFISLRQILPKIKEIFGSIEMILLFKPQFECGPKLARKYRGVIKDEKIHKALVDDFKAYLEEMGFRVNGIITSPIKGKSGNTEFLFHLN